MRLELSTQRMNLRLLDKGDADYLAELNVDPEIFRFFPKGTQEREQANFRLTEFVLGYEKYGFPMFLMFEKASGELIGRCGFGLFTSGEVEVGYVTRQQYWGLGYASEALRAILDWAKENLQVDHIIAMAPVEHLASQRVMHNGGMTFYKNDVAHGVACRFYCIRF